MKKLLVAAIAVALAVFMTIPASAFENEFGGYFRVRAFNNTDFSGNSGYYTDSTGKVNLEGKQDVQKVDTRTRIYYTAKFSDNLKLVNKFEIDNEWGTGDMGDIGADGNGVLEIKNTYLDMNIGGFNVKLGAHGETIGRGFVFDDDFSGVTVSNEMGSFYWIKAVEGGVGNNANDGDKDAYAIAPTFKTSGITINPYLVYVYQKSSDLKAYDLGVDIDADLKALAGIEGSAWFTGIYQGGDENSDIDYSAYLAAVGAKAKVAGIDVHTQIFYASGDDDANDKDNNNFSDLIGGQSYYWAEIMGYGIFDDQVSNGSCADKISDITAYNIGASMSPVEKVTVGADIWYATRNEAYSGDALGTEIDLSAKYQLMDNVNIDVVAAYLFADDGTTAAYNAAAPAKSKDEDPYELGVQLSLSF